jgi:hypothetical protein
MNKTVLKALAYGVAGVLVVNQLGKMNVPGFTQLRSLTLG